MIQIALSSVEGQDLLQLKSHFNLPEHIENFLLKYSSAIPEENFYEVGEENISSVKKFMSIKEIYSFESSILPSGILPICYDSFGNFTMVSLIAYEVFFGDHETSDLHLIASSIQDFLNNKLKPISLLHFDDEPIGTGWIDPNFFERIRKK